MFWALAQRIGKDGIMILVFFVLAAIVSPVYFGIIGMCYIWITFIKLFSDLGFPSALIQKKDSTSEHFSTIFYLNIIIGILLTLIGIGLSWPCATFFKNKDIQPVMAILSFCFIIDAFSSTQKIHLQKTLKFKELAVRDTVSALIGGIAGITFALLGYKIWSLVIQTLVVSIIGSLLMWNLSTWKPRICEVSFRPIKELWDFSSKMLFSEVLKYLAQNYDRFIIGYYLGPLALGQYTFALKIAVFPVKETVKAIGGYLFPKFSMEQDNLKKLKSSCFFLFKASNSIFAPISVLTALCAPLFIPLIFGSKWNDAIPLVQILSIVGFSYTVITPTSILMKSLNKPIWIIIWMICFTLVCFVSMWIGKMFGVVGSVTGMSIVYTLSIFASFNIAILLLKTNFISIIRIFYPSTISVVLMGAIVWIIMNSGLLEHISSKHLQFYKLGVGLFLGPICYLLFMYLINWNIFKEIYLKMVISIFESK